MRYRLPDFVTTTGRRRIRPLHERKTRPRTHPERWAKRAALCPLRVLRGRVRLDSARTSRKRQKEALFLTRAECNRFFKPGLYRVGCYQKGGRIGVSQRPPTIPSP